MSSLSASITREILGSLVANRARCAGLPKPPSGLNSHWIVQQRRSALGSFRRRFSGGSHRRSIADQKAASETHCIPCVLTGGQAGSEPLVSRRFFLGNLAASYSGTNLVCRGGTTLLFLGAPARYNGTVTAASQSTDAADRPANTDEEEDLRKKLDDLVKSTAVVLFMKGSPKAPMCGFSARAVGILNSLDVDEYTFVNILQYPDVRALAKKHFNWPTYPLLVVGGEVVGGVDIMDDLNKTGELGELIKKALKESEGAAAGGPEGDRSKA
uniref:Glutaredoxin, related n=2 Tax=Neospora caninum (strain Liverpool) TaxID=572307 RepID=A0A0F7UG62_NEOCL|nr:TPA: Glutaredoxin, related [Neospora caninum Liverpool]